MSRYVAACPYNILIPRQQYEQYIVLHTDSASHRPFRGNVRKPKAIMGTILRRKQQEERAEDTAAVYIGAIREANIQEKRSEDAAVYIGAIREANIQEKRSEDAAVYIGAIREASVQEKRAGDEAVYIGALRELNVVDVASTTETASR
ncbi:hypothetical protein BGZ60DRAFT_438088 [Tricladium varicosporioides]|nr:hypothetical protein BGZ60DRAFT_438088 [Hymenoscyphus varicosporioides]